LITSNVNHEYNNGCIKIVYNNKIYGFHDLGTIYSNNLYSKLIDNIRTKNIYLNKVLFKKALFIGINYTSGISNNDIVYSGLKNYTNKYGMFNKRDFILIFKALTVN
jgi:hypothetical protein